MCHAHLAMLAMMLTLTLYHAVEKKSRILFVACLRPTSIASEVAIMRPLAAPCCPLFGLWRGGCRSPDHPEDDTHPPKRLLKAGAPSMVTPRTMKQIVMERLPTKKNVLVMPWVDCRFLPETLCQV
jgi:hypothetical protein